MLFAYSLSLIISLAKCTLSPHKHIDLHVISLLNKHKIKDLTKTLERHIQAYFKRIIDYNQVEFITGI